MTPVNTEKPRRDRTEYRADYYKKNKKRLNALSKMWREQNREKALARSKQWREENPERCAELAKMYRDGHADYIKNYMLIRKYGMSLEQFDEMLQLQEGLCAMCGFPLEIGTRRVVVDHDHNSGAIRGIIHSSCNFILGISGDDGNVLKRGIEYLLHWKNVLSS